MADVYEKQYQPMWLGCFVPPTVNGRAEIWVTPPVTGNEGAFLHEIGHFLDFSALGGRGTYASEDMSYKEMDDWRRAVVSTPEIRQLRQLARMGDAHAQYLVDVPEIWARCYHQWVTERTQDRHLVAELQMTLTSSTALTSLSQWGPASFASIQTAIDDLFARLTWI